MANQLRNQIQLFFVIPVSKYKQVINPIKGIREYFFIKLTTLSNTQLNQKIIVENLDISVVKNKLLFITASSL